MAEIQWNMLANAPDAGSSALQGFQQGQQMQQRNVLMQRNEQDYQQRRQEHNQDREAEQRAEQLKQHHEQITMMGRLLDGVTDEATYQQARQAAQGIGIDLSEIPPNFDPQWLAQSKMQAKAITGQIERELMAVAPGTQVIDKHTGAEVYKNPDRPRYYPVPPGGRLELDPSYGGGAISEDGARTQPGEDAGGYTATNPQTGETVQYNPQTQAWEPVPGGAGQGGPQTFP